MKTQFIFWIATLIFSVLVQVRGQNPNPNPNEVTNTTTEAPTTTQEIETTTNESTTDSSASELPKSCSEIQFESGSNSSQFQRCTIYPHGNRTSLEVLCDFETDGGGWTILQKRSSGPRDEFNKDWNQYETGFGSLEKNFWIGLENIRALTQNGDQELRIQLENFQGSKAYAKYSNFAVSSASDYYRLSISGYYGDAGDDMNHYDPDYVHNGMRFSTPNKDNDGYAGNCAGIYKSGWWFNSCHIANLNGRYFDQGATVPYNEGAIWYSWTKYENSLAKTEMKIRKRK